MPKIFEPRPPIKVKDLTELNIEALLGETFTMTTITTEKKVPDGTSHITYNLIPKAVLSLKVDSFFSLVLTLLLRAWSY